ATGLVLDARRDGIDARLPRSFAYRVDKSRTLNGPAKTVLFVASDLEIEPMLHDPAYKLLVRHDALRPADRREITQLQAFVNHRIDKLIVLKRERPRDYARMLALDARGSD